jgi:hypothetical protein
MRNGLRGGSIGVIPLAIIMGACAGTPAEEVGSFRFEIKEAPPDVRCLQLQISVTGADAITRLVPTTPGQSTGNVSITGLPLGPATLRALAFNVECKKLRKESLPTWISDPVTTFLTGDPPVDVTFVMRKAGRANATFDFQPGSPPGPVTRAFAVDAMGRLVTFNLATPGTISSSVAISGLSPGEQIFGIDVRPVDKGLYAVGSTSRLYRIDPVGASATPIGPPFTPALVGTEFGVDFNPTVDRLRVVSDAGQNLRLNPDTGGVVAADVPITPSGVPISCLAYSNNAPGAVMTTLFALPASGGILYQIPIPNGGVLQALGVTSLAGCAGFDIAGPTNEAFAVDSTGLFRIDLTSGAATPAGTIGGGSAIVAFALQL